MRSPRTKGMGEKGEILDSRGNVVRTRKSVLRMAKELREGATTAEMVLWNFLRQRHRGIKFYRQAPIDRFVVDFYCPRKKLVIEVDGKIHERAESQESDTLREKFL